MSDESNKPVPPVPDEPSQTLGFGTAKAEATEVGQKFAARFPTLSLKERQQLTNVFRRELIPRRTPGKRPKKAISAAYADWRRGMRGPELYQKHIRNHPTMSQWRKKVEEQRLKEAMRSRDRRRRRRTGQ